MRRVSLKRVREVSKLALVRAGLNEEASEIVAERIALAERDLARSHGLFRLPSWVRALKSVRFSLVEMFCNTSQTSLTPGKNEWRDSTSSGDSRECSCCSQS